MTVTVIRDGSLPEFTGLPYAFDVSENTPVGRSLFTVIARDRDIQVDKLDSSLSVMCIWHCKSSRIGYCRYFSNFIVVLSLEICNTDVYHAFCNRDQSITTSQVIFLLRISLLWTI